MIKFKNISLKNIYNSKTFKLIIIFHVFILFIITSIIIEKLHKLLEILITTIFL